MTFFASLRLRLQRHLHAGEHLSPTLLVCAVACLAFMSLRIWISEGFAEQATAQERWAVARPELALWTAWAMCWALGLRLVEPILSRPARLLFHLSTVTLIALSAADLLFLRITGSRGDVEVVLTLVRSLDQTLPVILAELRWQHGVAALGVLFFGLIPMGWRARRAPLWMALPALGMLWFPLHRQFGTADPKLPTALRPLENHLFEQISESVADHLEDVEYAPDPAVLVPVQVAPGADYAPHNIVLVLLESTSAKRTTLFNPELDTTPNLSKLAADGLKVERMTAVVPHTSKALVATLCGQHPQLSAEIVEARPGGLPNRCLPELLEDLGFRTAYFQTATPNFESRFRLIHNLGFDLFQHRDTLTGRGFSKVNYFGLEERAMLEPGLAWSATPDPRPFFATWLTLSAHHDYQTPRRWPKRVYPGVSEAESDQLNAIRYVDDFVGRLVEGYRARGLSDNTLFVILGDHGEGFGEHGRKQHDLVIWEEGLHVPAVLYGPAVLKGRTGVIRGNRQQIDVLPTVLDVLGVDTIEGQIPGQSLLTEADPERRLYHGCWSDRRCLAERRGDSKLVDLYRDGAPRVYDLEEDPREKNRLKPLDLLQRQRGLRAWRAVVNGRYTALRERYLESIQRPDDAPALARWEDGPSMLRCDPERATLSAGEDLWLSCQWRAEAPIGRNLLARIRLVGAGWEQEVRVEPVDGLLPTWRWRAGLSVSEALRIAVPKDAPSGEARVLVGWESRMGRAVPRVDKDGEDDIEIGQVQILGRSPTQSRWEG